MNATPQTTVTVDINELAHWMGEGLSKEEAVNRILAQRAEPKPEPVSAPAYQDFCSALWAGGNFSYWWRKDGGSIWFKVENPASLPDGNDIYFGVNPTDHYGDTSQRAVKGDKGEHRRVSAINALYTEIDAKDFENGLDEARKHVEKLTPAPSMVVMSGGGFHCYWLLTDTFYLSDEANRQRAIRAQAGWVGYIGGDGGAKDIARILRVPGTMNTKYSPARMVTIQYAHFDVRYDLAFLEGFIAHETTSPAPVVAAVDIAGLPADENSAEYWLGRYQGQSAGNRDTNAMKLARQLRDSARLSLDEAYPYMERYAASCAQDPDPYTPERACRTCESIYIGGVVGEPAKSTARRQAEALDAAAIDFETQAIPLTVREEQPGEPAVGTEEKPDIEPVLHRVEDTNLPESERREALRELVSMLARCDLFDVEPAIDRVAKTRLLPKAQMRRAVHEASKPTPGAPGPGEGKKRATSPIYRQFLAKKGYVFTMNDMDDRPYVNGMPLTDDVQAAIRAYVRDADILNGTFILYAAAAEDVYLADAAQHKFHPVRDALDALEWDGQDHIKKLAYYFQDNENVFENFMRKWLIGAVARVYRKGKQNRTLVLAGGQDLGKSYFVRWLACGATGNTDYYREGEVSPDNKDHRLALMRVFTWEISEFGHTQRRADREGLKAFLTTEWIDERMPYAKFPIHKPALTSFVATINPEGSGFFDDPTGSRRFMTVELTGINWEYAKSVEASQLWAQAVALYKSGETGDLDAGEKAASNAINEEHRLLSPVYQRLDEIVVFSDAGEENPDDVFVTTNDVLDELKLKGHKTNENEMAKQVASWMQEHGVKKGKRTIENGTRPMGYIGIYISKTLLGIDGQTTTIAKWSRTR